MTELFEKSIRTLELPAVLDMLSQRAVSEEAKDRCRKLVPATDAEVVTRLLSETDAAKERLGLYGSPSFSGVKKRISSSGAAANMASSCGPTRRRSI